MTSANNATKTLAPPSRGRNDESGVQMTARVPLRPMNITPDVDALGYDPFEDRPTLVHADSWQTLAKRHAKPQVEAPVLLVQKKSDESEGAPSDWLASLPEAARAVLLAAAQPVDVDAPRVSGAIAQPRAAQPRKG